MRKKSEKSLLDEKVQSTGEGVSVLDGEMLSLEANGDLQDGQLQAIKKVLKALLLPEGKILAIAMILDGNRPLGIHEAADLAEMTLPEVETGWQALRAAKMTRLGHSIVLNEGVMP